MLTGMLPVFATETFWETFLPTMALPKLMLAGFVWMAALEFVPLAFTSPEQPLKNAAEELKTTTLAAHTHPLRLVFTVLISSGLCQPLAGAGGRGPAGIAVKSCPNIASRIGKEPVPLLLACRTVLVQGVKAFQVWRTYCPSARDYLARRTSGNWNSLAVS